MEKKVSFLPYWICAFVFHLVIWAFIDIGEDGKFFEWFWESWSTSLGFVVTSFVSAVIAADLWQSKNEEIEIQK